jgi:hypothetical protein
MATRKSFQIFTSGPGVTALDRAVMNLVRGYLISQIRDTPQEVIVRHGLVAHISKNIGISVQRMYRLLSDVGIDPYYWH